MRLIKFTNCSNGIFFVNPENVASVTSYKTKDDGPVVDIHTVDGEWFKTFQTLDEVCSRLTMPDYSTKEL